MLGASLGRHRHPLTVLASGIVVLTTVARPEAVVLSDVDGVEVFVWGHRVLMNCIVLDV